MLDFHFPSSTSQKLVFLPHIEKLICAHWAGKSSACSVLCKQTPNMADYYSLTLDCIGIVQTRVGTRLQLNKHQCRYMAKELSAVSKSLQGRGGLQNLVKLDMEDIRMKVLLHLHGIVKRAQAVVDKCCCEDSSWLKEAMALGGIKEEVAAILLDIRQWAYVNLDIAIAFVEGSSHIRNYFVAAVEDYRRFSKWIQSSEHPLQIAALQDKEALLRKVTNFLNLTNAQYEQDYLRGIYLKAQLDDPQGDLQSEMRLQILHPSSPFFGAGASGRVYKEDWLGLKVALKELGVVDKKEATLLGRIQHPNVVRFIHYWEVQGPCPHSSIVMELMPTDLKTHIKNEVKKKSRSKSSCDMPFSLPVVIDTMLQVAEAMRHLHDKRMTHRDLKTSNILVKPVDKNMFALHTEGYMEAKLADFGLAKEYGASFTPLTFKRGTTRYGAPEIFGKQETTSRKKNFPQKADVWSFGMVCSEILSGKLPFQDEKKTSTLHQRISHEGLRPSLPNDCPQYLKFCINSCWEYKPERRPSFTDLCRMLRCAKLLSLGMLYLDPIISCLFAYKTRRGYINVMSINSESSQQEWIPPRRSSSLIFGKIGALLTAGSSHKSEKPARRGASKAAKENDDFSSKYFTLQSHGIAKMILGDFQRALDDLHAASKLRPYDSSTLCYRGIVRIKQLGDLEAALRDLDEAIKYGAYDAYCRQHRGIAKMMLGDLEGARRDLGAADEYSPNDHHHDFLEMILHEFKRCSRGSSGKIGRGKEKDLDHILITCRLS